MDIMPIQTTTTAKRLDIFSDGSGGHQPTRTTPFGLPAWAFAVLGQEPDGTYNYWGFCGATMQAGLDNSHHANLGAPAATSMPAEIYAVIFGILWVLQSPHLHQLEHIHFHIDNEAAGELIIGQAQPTENAGLLQIDKAFGIGLTPIRTADLGARVFTYWRTMERIY